MAIVCDSVFSEKVSTSTCCLEKILLVQLITELGIFPHLGDLAQHPHLTTLEPDVLGIIVNCSLAVEAVEETTIIPVN